MAKDERIGAEHFFGSETAKGFFIGILIALIVLFFYALASQFSENKKTLEFKKYLFYSAASKLNELNENKNVNAINANFGIFAANFLKNELKKGNTIENIVNEELKIRVILETADSSDERQKIASHFVSQGTSQDIVSLAQHNGWKKFRENPENIKVFKELLAGNGKIPEIIYPNHPTSFLFWIVIFIIQLSTFGGYLIRMEDYYDTKFYQLQWSKIGTYLVIFLLLPGMLVILIPWTLWRCVSFDFSEFIKKRREAKLLKKNERRKEMEKILDSNVLRGKFSEHRKESEALLLKLESKLQKERGTA